MNFDYRSSRAKRARLARRIAGTGVYSALVFVGLAALAGGVVMVYFWETSFGWLVAGLAGLFWVIAGYGKGLRNIPPVEGGERADDLLDSDVLGLLPQEPSPAVLADVLLHTTGGRFMAARLGIGPIIREFSSANPEDMRPVWERADAIRQSLDQPGINAAMLAAALVQSVPGGSTALLAQLKLGDDDPVTGVHWFMHWQEMIARHKARRHDGGIGRDWSFGFTPLLGHFGFNISESVAYGNRAGTPLSSRRASLDHVMRLLSQGGRHNAALVGPLGVGKTTLVHVLAEMLFEPDDSVPQELRYRQIIALDPAALIARARGRGELEDLVQHLALEALQAKNAILFLDDAELFFEDGTGSVDISRVLAPIFEGGALKIILAMDEQHWVRITRANPSLAQYLNRVVIPQTDKNDTIIAMQDQVPRVEYQNKVTYSYQALDAAFRLSERYLSDQAMPGKAVKLLEAAAGFASQGLVTDESVAQAIEQTQGVKVSIADTTTERQTLLNLEQLIHERMINQTRAVTVVSDALRRARAGVRNTKRPIGTFLFLGPTGVGKTELAKSVAAVFFGGEDHLVRLDLNEYVRSEDVSRLIADASTDQFSLTAQISRQPFSVILLDEIEKAHSDVLGTLLQMLDEGIMRDINNREVSFRDAVVVATSNAGADRIREHIERGEQLEKFEEQFVSELINSGTFRPEFLNRFDEIVLFRPLNQEELMQVTDIILKGVNSNLVAQRVSVAVDDDAKKLLVAAGYDPRLGARPMRRVVQRVVENIVANQMLAGQVTPGGQVHVTADDVRAMLSRGKN